MHINMKSFTWENKEMIKSCLDLLKGIKDDKQLYQTLKMRGKKNANREVVWCKQVTPCCFKPLSSASTCITDAKNNAFLLEAFVNCNFYTWICVFFLEFFLCCNLMIGHMAHSVHSDFQMDDCNISLFISGINPVTLLNLHSVYCTMCTTWHGRTLFYELL